MSNSSDKIKNDVDFLKHDSNVNHDYVMIKSGKKLLNLHKKQVYATKHAKIDNFFISPQNNYSSTPFGNYFYVDFQIPRIQYTYYSFVLRFTLKNLSTSATATILPLPFMIDKVSLMKNSNSIGNDVDGSDVFLFNVNKYYENNDENELFQNLNITDNNVKQKVAQQIAAGGVSYASIELPICLNKSNLPACLFKEDLVIRCYFKNEVILDAISNAELKLSDVGLVCRMGELNTSQLAHIYKQPKLLNHMFNKRIVQRYNINNLKGGVEQSVNLAGFRNVAGAMLVYLSLPQNDIKFTNHNVQCYHFLFKINDVYIVDSSGRNIDNNNKIDLAWNNYQMAHHFLRGNQMFHDLSNSNWAVSSPFNLGNVFYIPFCADGSNSWTEVYSGGYSFNATGDHVLKFTPIQDWATNLVLNVIYFVPALLTLEDGLLKEVYA